MSGSAPRADSGSDDASGTAGVDLAVIIPHLNQAEALERCLESIAAQRGVDGFRIETIVVDNGSDAPPDALCARHGVTLLREAAPGPGPARNRAARDAGAPLLAFIDADCVADPGWVAAILRRFEDPRIRILGGDVRIARADPARATMLEAYESVFAYRMKEYIERQGFTGTGNLAVRREVYDAVGPFAGIEVSEDRDWGQRARALGLPIDYAPEMRVHHPARRRFSELFDKWSRHVGHDRVRAGGGALGLAKWLLRTAAVAASPIAELPRILRSDRISGPRERTMAFLAVCRVRAFRARAMLDVLRLEDGAALGRRWLRE